MRDFKDMGKRAGKTFLFFAILAVMLAGVSKKADMALLENDNFAQSGNKSTYRILREPQNSVDIIVVGDSVCYAAISPMELWEEYGMTAYVCGQSGQRIQESYYMLKNAFETQSPKLVILETNVMLRGAPGSSLTNLKVSLEQWASNYITVFRGHDVWKSLVTGKEYPEESYKGFSFRCVIQPYVNGDYMAVTEQTQEISPTITFYMEKIMELCEQNGAKLLLVGTPSPQNYSYSAHNGIAAYAEAHSLEYLDMNVKLEEVGINWQTDSLDGGDHLNLSGARKVTRYLGEYLNARQELPDHRGEAAYAAWQEEADAYEEKAKMHLREMGLSDGKMDGGS